MTDFIEWDVPQPAVRVRLMVEQLSPALSAFWATMFMIFVMLTQRPLVALMRGRGAFGNAFMDGAKDLVAGLEAGARNMIGIGVAGVHGQSAFSGRYFMFVYFAVCVVTVAVFLVQRAIHRQSR
jgi:hypothetical protein